MRRRSGVILAVGDGAALLLFVVIGMLSHGEGIVARGLLRTAVPLLGVWFVVAPLVGTYRRPGWRTMLLTWVIAVAGGLLIRWAIFHRPESVADLFEFMAVSLAFTLLFLSVWRAVAMWVGLTGSSQRAAAGGIRR